MSRTTVVIPDELRGEAKKLEINISDVCRYALEGALGAAKARKKAGDGYEVVRFDLDHDDDSETESVQFVGKQIIVFEDSLEAWYVTKKGSIVALTEEGGPAREGHEFEVYEGLGEFRAHVMRNSDNIGFPYLSRVLQLVERELGQVATPRMLDI